MFLVLLISGQGEFETGLLKLSGSSRKQWQKIFDSFFDSLVVLTIIPVIINCFSIFRQKALDTERRRAAKIAALPPPVDLIGVRDTVGNC